MSDLWLRLRRLNEDILLSTNVGQHFARINIGSGHGGDEWAIASYASGAVLQVQPVIIATARTKADIDRLFERLAVKLAAERI